MSPLGTSMNCPTPPISGSTSSPSPSSQSHPNIELSNFSKKNWASLAHEPQLYLAALPVIIPTNEAGSSKSLQFSRPKRKRITPEQLEVLSNLFEYTDTPTFDLREAIGSKLGMSNREVQVWFQNRRAKVNRQRIPSSSQVLQGRSVPSPIYQQQEPSPPSHRRIRSSPTHLLLPSVSSVLNSDSCRTTYSAPPLLPPFQATLPGIDSLQNGPVYQATNDPYPPLISPRNPTTSDSFFEPSTQIRPSTPGSRRRNPFGSPTSLNSRRSPRCRSPVPHIKDSTSADPPAVVHSDTLTSISTTSSQWNTGSSCNSWSLADSRSIPQTRLNYLPSSKLAPILTTPPQRWGLTPNDEPNSSAQKEVSSHSQSRSASRGSSEIFRFSHPSCGGATSPPVLPLSNQIEHEREMNSSSAPQIHRPGDAVKLTTRSLFASRSLPPLPNPVRPGPGSFPPPPALRIVPMKKNSFPTTLVRTSSNSASEFKLPPLLNDPTNS